MTTPRQFDVCINTDQSSRDVPYIINLQHDFARVLPTRLAAPLLPAHVQPREIANAIIRVNVLGQPHAVSVAEMAAVPVSLFGDIVANLEEERFVIMKAIDFLLSGY